MKPIFKYIFFGVLMFTIVYSCKRDELDIDKLSKTIEIQRDIAMPGGYGNLFLKDLLGEGADSIITIEGDTIFQDTIALDLGDFGEGFIIEFLNIPYHCGNYLPVGGDLMLITYDSVTARILDTIKFSQTGTFLEIPPLDQNGDVIENLVEEKTDVISVDKATAENLLRLATHIILDARLISETTRIIPVDDSKRIWLKLGIEARVIKTGSIN